MIYLKTWTPIVAADIYYIGTILHINIIIYNTYNETW